MAHPMFTTKRQVVASPGVKPQRRTILTPPELNSQVWPAVKKDYTANPRCLTMKLSLLRQEHWLSELRPISDCMVYVKD